MITGSNGQGKTNLLEAVGYMATLASFRGAPGDALVRSGAPRGVLRAEVTRAGRPVLIEAELATAGRDRVQVNRQSLRRTRDLLGSLVVSVFAPDDLVLVKGGPAERRRLLDDTLVALHPAHDALRGDLERILRQRNALLKSSGGRATPEVTTTLDVWDAQLVRAGAALISHRLELLSRLGPEVAKAYVALARSGPAPELAYCPSWGTSPADSLAGARAEDLRRGVTTVGPHRDEVSIELGGMAARTHSSQGEQRSLALALRLGAHAVVTEELGEAPVLLLDDVFSELDDARAQALLAHLPRGQALVTSAGHAPPGARPALVVAVVAGRLQPEPIPPTAPVPP